jgi:hypothetical protein
LIPNFTAALHLVVEDSVLPAVGDSSVLARGHPCQLVDEKRQTVRVHQWSQGADG